MKLLLRKIRGAYSALIYPGFGYCYRCFRRWPTTQIHETDYSESHGCFPLCEDCWRELTPVTRLPYYHKMYQSWLKNKPPDLPAFEEIARAVREGK